MASQKPSKVVLTYFPFPGRAAPLHSALKLAKIPYENKTLTFPEFGANKDDLVFGRVPVLEVDDLVLGQSNAALVYVGRFVEGLVPSDRKLEAQALVALGLIEDGYGILTPSLIETDADKTIEMRKVLIAEGGRLTKYLFYVDRYLAKLGTGYFAGAFTIAELKAHPFFQWLQSGMLDGFPATILDAYPAIKKNVELAEVALAAVSK
jgi:glutathione S-transferase